jgi:hypothetical protein
MDVLLAQDETVTTCLMDQMPITSVPSQLNAVRNAVPLPVTVVVPLVPLTVPVMVTPSALIDGEV